MSAVLSSEILCAYALPLLVWVLITAVFLRIGVGFFALSWFPSSWIVGGYDPLSCRLLAARLASCLGAQEPLESLRAYAQLQLDGPSRRRLGRFLRSLQGHGEISRALTESRLLPRPQRQLLCQLPTGQPQLMQRALERYALQSDRQLQQGPMPAAVAMVVILISWLSVFLAFLFAVMVPRFEQIFFELGLELPALTKGVLLFGRGLEALAPWWILVLLVIFLVNLLPRAVSMWWHAWQPGRRALDRAWLLLDGLALSLPEQRLAAVLGYGSGEAGSASLASLASACGLQPAPPADLARQVHEAEERYQLRLQLVQMTLALLLWMLAAVVVGLIVAALFVPLVEMMRALS
ncbi:MAG: hypothetical protein EA402_13775 [Planctomycetota bacterium]|nr:MAG: hypothetical protein EA402_13775 [Planctomycetota bacterium]